MDRTYIIHGSDNVEIQVKAHVREITRKVTFLVSNSAYNNVAIIDKRKYCKTRRPCSKSITQAT